ncbi:DNA-3-methyladenine glycosylase I [Limosilactobacillus sp.]|uniref:DNA-3-methyladenine glycosylase I n=1 Tax=Limosilactobacillus sp. TaxID=2773925 RepID=UPI00345E562F
MTTLVRPKWAQRNALMQDYYDHHWGLPIHDDYQLFEMLSLEIFEAGLNWSMVWKRRQAFEDAFANFDFREIAFFDDDKIYELAQNSRIIRNHRKIMAVVKNARLVALMADSGTSLDNYLWEMVGGQPLPSPVPLGEALPLRTAASTNVAQQMKADGFSRVGPATAMSLMAAVGMIDVKHLNK